MKIHRIIYNNDATIVFWKDGTKTVVKREKNTEDDRYAAIAAAIAIKEYGSNSAFKTAIKKAEKEKTTIKPKIPENIWLTSSPYSRYSEYGMHLEHNAIVDKILREKGII